MTDGPCRASGPRRDGCEVRGCCARLVFNAEKQSGGETEGAVPGINIENREKPYGDIEREDLSMTAQPFSMAFNVWKSIGVGVV